MKTHQVEVSKIVGEQPMTQPRLDREVATKHSGVTDEEKLRRHGV